MNAPQRAPAAPAKPARKTGRTFATAADAMEDRRKRGVQAIKAAQRQMGLDDGTYRELLAAQTGGKRSATELTVHEIERVLDYMRTHGAPHPKTAQRGAYAGGRKRVVVSQDKVAMRRRIDGLLADISRARGVPHSLLYADAICRRRGWAECVDFCSPEDLHKLIGALSRTLNGRPAPKR